jgi:hypothetical protein
MSSDRNGSVKAYATLRIAGDKLVPEQVTQILKVVPTTAYAKGEHYSGGPRSPDLIGRTGVWYFCTDGIVAGNRSAITWSSSNGCCTAVTAALARCGHCSN